MNADFKRERERERERERSFVLFPVNIYKHADLILTIAYRGQINTSESFCSPAHFFVCMFGIYRPTWNISLIWRRHHCRWRAANVDLCSTIITIEQWWFFVSLTHRLWHGTSVYNAHLRRPVPRAPIPNRMAVELSLPVLTS